jgi:hypothetical protein
MSQALAFANGWNLATTLMVCVVVFNADNGNYGVMLLLNMTAIPAPSSTNSTPSNPHSSPHFGLREQSAEGSCL